MMNDQKIKDILKLQWKDFIQSEIMVGVKETKK